MVCCYTENRWDDLVAALRSVEHQTRPADDVVVVVDHAPALATRLRHAFAHLRVVENTATPGLSGARNTGIAATEADIVAFLDDDAVAATDWLDALIAPYADPAVTAVGGAVTPRWDARRPRWFPREFDWVVGCTYAGHPDAGPVRNVIGANMSFRRDVVVEAGGFDERVGRVGTHPAGCEETELCIRVRQRRPAAVVWYTPAAQVSHRVRAERADFAYFRARCRAEGASKARVASMVGHDDGLASERSYARETLPRATLRDLRSAAFDADFAGAARSFARGAGLVFAGVGYVEARIRSHDAARLLPPSSRDFRPAIVATASPRGSTHPTPVTDADPAGYARALVLVRDGDRPIGVAEVELDARGLGTEEVAAETRRVLEGAAVSAAATPREPLRRARPPEPVTVVVATCGRPELLRRCLDSILRSDYPDFDVLVVDNTTGGAESLEVVAEYGPEVRWVREPRPGLANAHNRALAESIGSIVAFTDDDVVVDPAWIRNLVGGFDAAANVACVTGMIFPLELETAAQDLVERSVGYGKGFDRQVHRLGARDVGPLFPYAAGRFGSGASMAFRSEWLRRAGGFDPALGVGTAARGGDDLAAFFSTVASGATLVYEPAALVFHAHRREESALARQAFGYGAGLTAYLTSAVVEQPARTADIARRIVPGLRHAFATSSDRNAGRPADHPRSLRVREVVGMACGPFLYLRSRRVNPRREVRAASESPASGAPAAAVVP